MNVPNLSQIRSRDPQLAEALQALASASDNLATQTNGAAQGTAPVPNAPPNLVVTASNGVYNAAVATAPPAGSQHLVEYSATPNFASPIGIPFGPGVSQKDINIGPGSKYWRVRTVSLLPNGGSSAAVYHGTATNPAPVTANGSSATNAPSTAIDGGAFIPASFTPVALARAVTTPGVAVSSVVINGSRFTLLKCTATAPANVTGQANSFQALGIALGSFEGSTYPQLVGTLQYTGAAAGAIELDVILPPSTDTVTVYFVSINTANATVADWTTSPNVSTVSLNPAPSVPAAPTGLAASARTAAAILSWVGVVAAGVEAYRVYRSTTNTFTTAAAVGISPAISGLDANGNTPLGQFRDDTAASGTPYFYWITSVVIGPVESLPTASVTVTPL